MNCDFKLKKPLSFQKEKRRNQNQRQNISLFFFQNQFEKKEPPNQLISPPFPADLFAEMMTSAAAQSAACSSFSNGRKKPTKSERHMSAWKCGSFWTDDATIYDLHPPHGVGEGGGGKSFFFFFFFSLSFDDIFFFRTLFFN